MKDTQEVEVKKYNLQPLGNTLKIRMLVDSSEHFEDTWFSSLNTCSKEYFVSQCREVYICMNVPSDCRWGKN